MSIEEMVEITLLPHGRRVRSRRGVKLLEALIGANIFLRSDCGGRGTCGKCAVDLADGRRETACTTVVEDDLALQVPASSLMSSAIIDKAPANLPDSFLQAGETSGEDEPLGLAVDLGTTTIALYLCGLESRRVRGSLAVKNPQALHGDDVMSRIGAIGDSSERLAGLRQLVCGAVGWGASRLLAHAGKRQEDCRGLVVVGNPAMIHIFFGVSPASIGIAPYRPAFYELDPGQLAAGDFGLDLAGATIQSLPLVSGFLGSDILAAALATDLARQPAATLLIDLGTNGELLLKGHDGYYATSCATGPAFEGASLTCGMQAVAGAVNRIVIDEASAPPRYTVINGNAQDAPRPLGICGSGIVSGVAAMVRTGLVAPSGLLVGGSDKSANHNRGRRYVVVPAERAADGREIAISQKDIRAVQLGKGALLTGIEFLLRAAGLAAPEKVIVAGAFGSYLEPADMLTLGMLPPVAPERIHFAGNSAGAGAIMALCDPSCRTAASELARSVQVVELTANPDFQRAFVERLGFP